MTDARRPLLQPARSGRHGRIRVGGGAGSEPPLFPAARRPPRAGAPARGWAAGPTGCRCDRARRRDGGRDRCAGAPARSASESAAAGSGSAAAGTASAGTPVCSLGVAQPTSGAPGASRRARPDSGPVARRGPLPGWTSGPAPPGPGQLLIGSEASGNGCRRAGRARPGRGLGSGRSAGRPGAFGFDRASSQLAKLTGQILRPRNPMLLGPVACRASATG